MAISASYNHFRSLLLPALLSYVAILSGCSSTPKPAKCSENQGAYLQAKDLGPLKTPLDAPIDARTALTIPPGNGKAVDKTVCLQRSPPYFGTAGRIAASPEEIVADWAQAWSERNSAVVMSMYADKFSTDAPSGSAAWLAQRSKEVSDGPVPNGRVTNLQVVEQGDDRRVASFVQHFGATSVHKELNLVRDAGSWKISAERVISAQTK